MNRKQILRELLPLLLPVNSGVHSIIIDGYLDIQAAIRAKYLEIIQAEFKRKLEAPQPRVTCLEHRENCTCSHWRQALDRPEQFNNAFAVFDEEPGYIDRAIWILYENWVEPTEGLFYLDHPARAISPSTLKQAVRAYFPDAHFDGVAPSSHAHHCSQPLSDQAVKYRSLQVYLHCAKYRYFQPPNTHGTELYIYKKSGAKPELFKPPLTTLGRLQARYNKWTEQRDDQGTRHYLDAIFYFVALLLLGSMMCLAHPVDYPLTQRTGAHGVLWCTVVLAFLILRRGAKDWSTMSLCDRIVFYIAWFLCVAVITMSAQRVLQNVPQKFELWKYLKP